MEPKDKYAELEELLEKAWDRYSPVLPIGQVDKKTCWHTWVEYTGLTEKYFFCKHCDEKYRKE